MAVVKLDGQTWPLDQQPDDQAALAPLVLVLRKPLPGSGSLKYECVYLNAFETGPEARRAIGAWITRYKDKRPHSPHRLLTPGEAYNSQGPDLKMPPEVKPMLQLSPAENWSKNPDHFNFTLPIRSYLTVKVEILMIV